MYTVYEFFSPVWQRNFLGKLFGSCFSGGRRPTDAPDPNHRVVNAPASAGGWGQQEGDFHTQEQQQQQRLFVDCPVAQVGGNSEGSTVSGAPAGTDSAHTTASGSQPCLGEEADVLFVRSVAVHDVLLPETRAATLTVEPATSPPRSPHHNSLVVIGSSSAAMAPGSTARANHLLGTRNQQRGSHGSALPSTPGSWEPAAAALVASHVLRPVHDPVIRIHDYIKMMHYQTLKFVVILLSFTWMNDYIHTSKTVLSSVN